MAFWDRLLVFFKVRKPVEKRAQDLCIPVRKELAEICKKSTEEFTEYAFVIERSGITGDLELKTFGEGEAEKWEVEVEEGGETKKTKRLRAHTSPAIDYYFDNKDKVEAFGHTHPTYEARGISEKFKEEKFIAMHDQDLETYQGLTFAGVNVPKLIAILTKEKGEQEDTPILRIEGYHKDKAFWFQINNPFD